jgi:metallo-beta-lactamase family protein
MKITFLGATGTVTGSNFLVEGAGKKFLVDCGMYQGQAKDEEKNFDDFAFNPTEIDFMLLTHAHIDHSGRIPKLYNEGFRNPIYATKATCDLCKIMLPDSGHIQEMEAEWKNRKRIREGKAEVKPLYTADDATKSIEVFVPIKYSEIIDVAENISVRFNDAGHMLGSSIIEVWITENNKTEKAVFSGDIGNNEIPLLSSPTMIESADYLIMESTYGNRLHVKNESKATMFLNIVSSTIIHGGNVIIPSFAVGRTQEILYELNKIKDGTNDSEFINKYNVLMQTPVYVDSPLAISATEIFKQNEDLFDYDVKEEIERGDNPLEFDGLKFTKTADESRALNESQEPCIIISASGMCDVGRIKHHLKHNLWNPKSTILFVGYQAPGTLGRIIVDGAKKVKIFGEEIAVNARVEYIEGYSGHADQEWLLNFVYSFFTKPKQIILVHGEEESQNILKQKIEDTTNISVTIPKLGEKYELRNNQIQLIETVEMPQKISVQRESILDRISILKAEIDDMETILREDILKQDAIEHKEKEIKVRLNEIERLIVEIISE